MEKYARQAVSEGIKNSEDLHVGADSEIYRVLNLHYNRNNHIEVWGPQVRIFKNHTLLFLFPLVAWALLCLHSDFYFFIYLFILSHSKGHYTKLLKSKLENSDAYL